MLGHINIERIVFLDIETVPQFPDYDLLSENFKKLWDRKCEFIRSETGDTPDMLYERAGIYSEFGKIVCISVGIMKNNEVRIKSYFGDDESVLLKDFAYLLKTYYNAKDYFLCAHNGKEFDYPYIARRMLVNGINIPPMLELAGKKPWEVPHLDTMELWKFGDFKNYTSLELLAAIFNIPTPKDDIRGSDVARIYWKEKDLERIAVYCQKDVLTIIQLFLKYQLRPLLKAEQVVYVE
ncbi:MAG: 3'-5' exonuclease [Bacteroidales bacterium]|nr:3'-5' exonuclease [Bacteroidales bacterium]MCF8345326.1 3'-5' exonuclease [Bacteroidales bacterium]MCF8349607.1 3'-5' exonuclease [Bacteroidales bacterium]MCF8376048.1 3'-5' exonuclease [Bacteroidales bacterium]MCF8400419.1 3'-5' exonuclease [Bacteroidales bacterium]